MMEHVMSEAEFWETVRRSAEFESDPERQIEALAADLNRLPPDDVAAFERAFQREQARAYTWDLWGAAYVAHGGASDDGFEYFQRWLISKGRAVFEAVLADPDSLADMLADDVGGPLEFEEFAYVARRVWAAKTGNDRSDPNGLFPYTGAPPADQPSGVPFEDSPEYLAKRYPRLWARFGNNPLL